MAPSHAIRVHWATAASAARVESHQALAFASNGDLEHWFTAATDLAHQRLELKTDLIAANILRLGTVPAAQFLG